MKNKLRKALLDRHLTLGTWMQIGHPACAEILAGLGFDWICVDLEHGAIDLETMANIFRTLDAFDCVPIVRVPWADPIWIRRSLDAGARGLIIPMVNTEEQARLAIRESKYPPMGQRGYGYSRANRHGLDFHAYINSANSEIPIIVQIEHKDAIANLDSILAVEGVDGAFIGPLDLSGSFGKSGDLDCPEMRAALAAFRDGCAKRRKSAGFHVVRPDGANVRNAIEQGYTMLALGVDNVFLAAGAATTLEAARGAAVTGPNREAG
ncbi:MAG: HpcH/HpaI aldolase family protein [Bryobacteraceae bacterium]